MNTGDIVYVRWYGKVLEGSVVNTDDLFGLTAVRIPVQGTHATALFHPGHIYNTPPAANVERPVPSPASCTPAASLPPAATVTDVSPSVQPCAEFRQLQQFKHNHWDSEHNHLCIDALDAFYSLYRDYMAMRSGMMTATRKVEHMTIEHPDTPAEAMSPVPTPQQSPVVHPSGIVAAAPILPTKPTKPIQLSLW